MQERTSIHWMLTGDSSKPIDIKLGSLGAQVPRKRDVSTQWQCETLRFWVVELHFLSKTTTLKKSEKIRKTASAAALAARRNASFLQTASGLPDPTRTHEFRFILPLFSWLIFFRASMYMRVKKYKNYIKM